jgi:hypothetical protein
MSKLECGCVELPAPAKPRLRLVRKVDPLDPRFVWIECRRQARQKVKEQLRREAVRAQWVPIGELHARAQAYLEEHQEELLAQAKASLAYRNRV